MPIANIDDITIMYGKEKHLSTHFRVATQVRAWLKPSGKMVIHNLGEPTYDYEVRVGQKSYIVKTKRVDITDRIFENVVISVAESPLED